MPNVRMIDVVSAIHKKVREQPVSYDDPTAIEDWSNDLAKLHSAYNAAYTTRNSVAFHVLEHLPKDGIRSLGLQNRVVRAHQTLDNFDGFLAASDVVLHLRRHTFGEALAG